MKRAVALAGILAALALLAWWAARHRPTRGVPGRINLPPPEAAALLRRKAPSAAGVPLELPTKTAAPAETTARPNAVETPPSRSAGQKPQGRPAPAAEAQLQALEDILKSKNDNDPRLDHDFKSLSPEAKRLFRQKYRSIPAERRNDRGTIVYLLGKNSSSAEDWAFLRDVVREPPCLSMADCSQPAKSEDPRRELGLDVTLAYPALVALRQAQQVLEQDRGRSSVAAEEARGVIRAARDSQAPLVAKKAVELARLFEK